MAENILINDLGPMGDGIHRSDGGIVYIPRVLPGERVLADVRPEAAGVSRGDVREILTPSPHRMAAPCVHYEVCGGCTMQHAETAFYRDWKLGVVRKALDREKLEPKVCHAAVFLENSRRRRATFAAIKKNGVVTLGYFRRRSHEIGDISGCLVADPAVLNMRARLGAELAPLLHEGKTTDVFIQTVNQSCDVVITGPFGKAGKADLAMHEALASVARIPHLARLSWRAREHTAPETMLDVAPLHAAFGLLNVSLPPLAFLQPTTQGEAALVAAVLQLLPPKGNFADLFSGCGTFAGSMLMRGPVDAFEHAAAAAQALNKSKGTLPLKVVQRDLFRKPLQPEELKRYDAVVFDPPRAGACEQARALATSGVPLLIAVSCNPATFARDARILVDGGYHFETMRVVDQFPWTHHVELIASFRKMH